MGDPTTRQRVSAGVVVASVQPWPQSSGQSEVGVVVVDSVGAEDELEGVSWQSVHSKHSLSYHTRVEVLDAVNPAALSLAPMKTQRF